MGLNNANEKSCCQQCARNSYVCVFAFVCLFVSLPLVSPLPADLAAVQWTATQRNGGLGIRLDPTPQHKQTRRNTHGEGGHAPFTWWYVVALVGGFPFLTSCVSRVCVCVCVVVPSAVHCAVPAVSRVGCWTPQLSL